jgi:DNA processing protein
MDHSKYWVWLSAIPKVGARRCIKLLEHFKEPKGIWEASKDELLTLQFMNEETIYQVLNKRYRQEAEKHVENIIKQKISIVTIKSEVYPYYLKNIHDPPIVLYTNGGLNIDEKFVAVVGSRKASSYGLEVAQRISNELSGLGITVVSGMARGIDSSAHNGALKAEGRTIAILGCGPDIVYPSENKALMDRIRQSGAVISEYLPGTQPVPQNFPARNRIISGLSLGVVVVEAGIKSGSLITADFALEQGREVFAVPGNINSLNSKGTNRLIKDGAKIVTCIDDIIEELNVSVQKNSRSSGARKSIINFDSLEKDELGIVKQLEVEEMHIDRLAAMSGLSMHVINSTLIILEMKGIIEQIPGKIIRLRE